MAKTTTNPFTQTIKNPGLILLPSTVAQVIDAVGVVTNTLLFCTAGAEGSVLKSMIIASNDTAAKYVSVWIQPGGTGSLFLLGQVAVPLTSGFSATGVLINIDVLNNAYLTGLALDQTGRQVLPLEAGTIIRVGMVAAPTAAKCLYVTGVLEDF